MPRPNNEPDGTATARLPDPDSYLNMRPDRTHSDDLVNSLQDLRALSELCRAELYWNIQRLSKSRRCVAALHANLRQRKRLRIYQQPLSDLWIPNLPPHAA